MSLNYFLTFETLLSHFALSANECLWPVGVYILSKMAPKSVPGVTWEPEPPWPSCTGLAPWSAGTSSGPNILGSPERVGSISLL